MLLCQLVLELFLCVHILVLLVGLFASIKAREEARFGVERPPPPVIPLSTLIKLHTKESSLLPYACAARRLATLLCISLTQACLPLH